MDREVKKRRIFCLGDSNTYGYDPRAFLGGRYPAEVRWTELLQREDRALFNGGQNGASIPRTGELPAVAAWVQSLAPLSALTVMLGSNDLLQGAPAELAAQRMEALLLSLREAAPEALLLLIAPPRMALGDWVPSPRLVEESARLAELYAALAARLKLPFLDAGEWGIALSFDGVHFTPEGHRAFARGLDEALCAHGL